MISRVWSSCLKSRKEEERVHEEDKRTWSNGSSQTRRYRNQPEEATPERSTQHSKQPTHEHGMICGMRDAVHMHDLERNDLTWPQHGNPRVPLER